MILRQGIEKRALIMDNNYMISIVGTQEVDGEKETIEVMTEGDIIEKNGRTYISYREYCDDNPKNYSHNLIKLEDDGKITIIRKGETESRLILEKGKRHQCYYRTIAGDLMIGIFTEFVKRDISPDGGSLNIKYSIDFNNDLVSNNEFYIKVTKKAKS